MIALLLAATAAWGQGLLPTTPTQAARARPLRAPLRAVAALPASVDLSRWMPPLGDQGDEGSCVGWATAYAKTWLDAKEHRWDVRLRIHRCSPAAIYNLVNGGYDNGAYFQPALRLLTQNGCPSLSAMPYVAGRWHLWPNPVQCREGMPARALDYGYLFVQGGGTTATWEKHLQQVKALVASGQPVIVGVECWSDFGAEPPTYLYDGPDPEAWNRGGHAMLVVGYDDARSALRVANSWGADWGDKGYVWISYGFFRRGHCFEAWALTDRVAYQPRASAQVDITHTYRGDLRVVLGVRDKSGSNLWTVTVLSAQGGSYDDVHLAFDVSDGARYLPPSAERKWFAYVRDGGNGGTGKLTGFSLTSGAKTWRTTDVPLALPEGVGKYAYIKG